MCLRNYKTSQSYCLLTDEQLIIEKELEFLLNLRNL